MPSNEIIPDLEAWESGPRESSVAKLLAFIEELGTHPKIVVVSTFGWVALACEVMELGRYNDPPSGLATIRLMNMEVKPDPTMQPGEFRLEY